MTVLFVDIVDSTRWISLLGDQRWLDLQEEQEAMAREVVRKCRGTHLRPTGDGFVVTFPNCVAALHAARVIVESTRSLGISVRAALHCGECEIRGRKAAGIVFHICARIVALAQADEVLVSRAVREVAPASIARFAHRGSHALKGLPGEWDLFCAQNCDDEDRPTRADHARAYDDPPRDAVAIAG